MRFFGGGVRQAGEDIRFIVPSDEELLHYHTAQVKVSTMEGRSEVRGWWDLLS